MRLSQALALTGYLVCTLTLSLEERPRRACLPVLWRHWGASLLCRLPFCSCPPCWGSQSAHCSFLCFGAARCGIPPLGSCLRWRWCRASPSRRSARAVSRLCRVPARRPSLLERPSGVVWLVPNILWYFGPLQISPGLSRYFGLSLRPCLFFVESTWPDQGFVVFPRLVFALACGNFLSRSLGPLPLACRL